MSIFIFGHVSSPNSLGVPSTNSREGEESAPHLGSDDNNNNIKDNNINNNDNIDIHDNNNSHEDSHNTVSNETDNKDSGEEGLRWEGHWHFAKSRALNTSFSYQKKTQSVAKELVDYVSFVNEQKKRHFHPSSSSKKRKGKSHRKSSSSSPGAVEVKLETEEGESCQSKPPLSSSSDTVIKEEEHHEEQEEDDEDQEEQGGEEGGELDHSHEQEEQEQQREEVDTSKEKKSPQADQHAATTTSVYSADEDKNGEDAQQPVSSSSSGPEVIDIPPRHPLFGVWEGHFTLPVKTSTPGHRGEVRQEAIPETFFFYAFEGEHQQQQRHFDRQRGETPRELQSGAGGSFAVAGLEQLPHPPRWTAAYIRELYVDRARGAARGSSSSGRSGEKEPRETGSDHEDGEELGGSSNFKDSKDVKEDDEDTQAEPRSGGAEDSRGQAGGRVTILDPKDAQDTSQQEASSPTALSSKQPKSPRYSQPQVTPNTSALVPPEGEEMIVGFGRNQFGRFSLAGAYNPRTGSLRCERKYMLTKHVTPTRQSRSTPKLAHDDSSFGSSVTRPIRAKRPTTPSDHPTMMGFSYDEVSLSQPPKRGKKKSQGSAGMTSSQFLAGLNSLSEREGYHRAFLDPVSGEVYEGEWQHGQRNGFGVALFPDGTMYEGYWLHGREHGTGLWMTGAREILYSGEWAEGRIHGSGTYYFPSGDVYTGEFKEGARQGRGTYTRADGSTYDGDWKDNLRHGRGTFTWTDGSEYDGEWELGQRSGRGELVLSNGLTYSGTWAGNVMDGRGSLQFPDGQEYKGILKNGLREGRGSIEFPEGAIYEGRFKEDALDGQGTLKILKAVPGAADDEIYIPLANLADIRRIHYKSGFGGDGHH